MTANKRIFLNIVATYGRSVYALAVGLFTARWALQALGQMDYGLFGLIGGIVSAVSFLNSLLAAAVGRFYAFYVGAAKKSENMLEGIEECKKWFNTALVIHSALPFVLVCIGYPIGAWAVEHFFVIPFEKVDACIWVWRFTCISCFIGMVNVPFHAMYIAKQEIAELTIYSFVTTTLNAVFLYYMITHPGVWLVRYAAWMCFIGVMPQFIIAIRAVFKYSECRLNVKYFFNIRRYVQIGYFALARFWAEFSAMFSNQGRSILVNKFMGGIYNASVTIGNTVAVYALTLAASVDGALWPAITNKAGEGDINEVKRLCFVTFKLSTIMVLIFAIPLCLEAKIVMELWLVNPPDFSDKLCVAILISALLERMSYAYAVAINGVGKGVMKYSFTIGCAVVSGVLIAWVLFVFGLGMWSVIIGFVVAKIFAVVVRLYFGRMLIGFSARQWIMSIFVPISLVTIIVAMGGLIPRFFLGASFMRILVTTSICEVMLLFLTWRFILDRFERTYVLQKFHSSMSKVLR